MKKIYWVLACVGLSGLVFGEASFEADTLAFYPFNEGAVGTTPTQRQPVILNAVDAEAYPGTPRQITVYGTLKPMTYSDDVPAAYIYANDAAGTPLYGPGEFHAITFPDMATGTDSKGVYWPLETNETTRSAIVTYADVNGSKRPQGCTSITLAGLNTALANESAWTVEMFFRVDSECTRPGSGNGQSVLYAGMNSALAQTKLQFVAQNGAWNSYWMRGSTTASINLDTSHRAHEVGWQHLALVHADNQTTVYLNYEAKKTMAHTYDTPAEGDVSPIILGDTRDHYPSLPFYGKMAALRVMKRALTTEEFLVASDSPDRTTRQKVITGDYEVAAAGECYESILVNGPAHVTGGALIAERGLTMASGTATFDNAELRISKIGAALDVQAGAALVVNAPIGGTDLLVRDDGTLTFAGANTFTGALTLKGAGVFHAANDAAFGTAEGGTSVYSRTADGLLKVYFDGVDINESFNCWFATTSVFHFSDNTTNVLRGAITGMQGRNSLTFHAGSYTVISNSITAMEFVIHDGHKTARVDIHGALGEYRANFGAGTYHHFVRHPKMAGYNYGLMPSVGTHVMEIENVFAESAEATQAYDTSILRFNHDGGTLDLNGHNQRFASFAGEARGVITSATPATFYLDAQVAPYYTPDNANWVPYERLPFNGAFKGAAAFAVEGPLPVDMGGVNTTTGRLTVANGGTVKFLSAASWAGDDIVVTGEGSRLEFTAGANLPSERTKITIAEGGRLCVASGTVRMEVAQLVVDGEELTESGTYGAVGSGAQHELACFEGAGMFSVQGRQPAVGIWSAGGAADKVVSAESNWKDGVVPDSLLGVDSAIFSEAGETATVDTLLWLRGLTLQRPVGGTFTFAAGGGSLLLGNGGLVAEENRADAARYYTNNVPTTIGDTQTWLFPSEHSTFVQNGVLTGGDSVTLKVTGNGDFHLTADNSTFRGDMDFSVSDDASCSGVVAHVWHPCALGGPEGITRVGAKTVSSTSARTAKLVFHGTNEIDRVLDFYGNDSPRFALAEENAKVTFRKKFNIHGGLLRPQTPNGSEVVFAGGLSTGCYRVPPPYGGKVVITNTTCALGSFDSTSFSPLPSAIEIHTSSNTYSSGFGISLSGNILVDLYATDAISRTSYDTAGGVSPMIRLGVYRYDSAHMYWTNMRLNGHDQHTAFLDEKDDARRYATEESHSCILSDTPAQLCVLQNVDRLVSSLAFEGAAGLTLEGTGTLTLSNVTSTTTGRLDVAGGNLVLHSAWPNVAEVTVNGALALKAPQRFGKRVTVVRLDEGGTLDLGGNDQYVKEVYVDGVRLRARTYTAASPELKGRVTGAGNLRVFGDGPGTAIYLR